MMSAVGVAQETPVTLQTHARTTATSILRAPQSGSLTNGSGVCSLRLLHDVISVGVGPSYERWLSFLCPLSSETSAPHTAIRVVRSILKDQTASLTKPKKGSQSRHPASIATKTEGT